MSKVRAEQYTNRLGTGAPEIPYGVIVPEGASIDGAGGLNLTGIATAGTFKGNLTGDVSGNVTGLAATFTGPVTIGGTLTYEDVTNIDSVGVITARDVGGLIVIDFIDMQNEDSQNKVENAFRRARIKPERTVNAAAHLK